jgi:glycogen debranching enzyme
VHGSVDATLLWVLATQRVVDATGDLGFLKLRLKDVLFGVLEALRTGAADGARATPDGFLAESTTGSRLLGIAPRALPLIAIETQALWCNALLIGADLAAQLGEPSWALIWNGAASRVRESVQRLFWSERAGHLADSLTPDGPDLTLRPHQLFAIGLPHCLLPADRALRVLEAVEQALLTPVGLRSCAADQRREAADELAWPAVMGLYFEAVIRLRGEEGKRQTRAWLRDFGAHLDQAGLGHVSASFEAEPPYRPVGPPAHAPAVAELLRLCHRVAGRPPATRGTPPAR